MDKCTCSSGFQSGICDYCINLYKKQYQPKETTMDKKYTELDVIQMLVVYGNETMKLLQDNKEFVINNGYVECWRRNKIFPDKLLSSESFKFVIIEAGGIYNG